ncbi:MAG: alanine glycine permease, partial [Flavobacteriales bacterium]|nr:alanine glycine permease [Flavobacteriales bacterium]
MIPRIAFLLLSLVPWLAHAQDSVDDRINAVMEPVTDAIMSVIFFTVPIGGGREVPFVLIWLLTGALIFTLYNRFVNITAFGHALDVVRGKFDDPNHKGEVSHFQALTA